MQVKFFSCFEMRKLKFFHLDLLIFPKEKKKKKKKRKKNENIKQRI